MIWNVCFILSVLVLIVGGVTALIRKKSKKILDPHLFFVLVITVFISAMLMFFALEYTGGFEKNVAGALNAALLAIRDTIGIFVVDGDFSFHTEQMQGMLPTLIPAATMMMAVFYVAAPLFTFGFVLSFFKNLRSRWLLACYTKRDVYVFSDMNEKSLVLAKDLKSHDARRVIVFCDVFESDEEQAGELLVQARRINALICKRDILDINFKKHAQNGSVYFFITGEDDAENIKQAVGLIDQYGQMESANLYLFSDSASGELLLCDSKKHKMKIRRINESVALIQKTLYDQPKVVFEQTSAVNKNGDKILSAVIVGLGGYGSEMLKTLLWYGQMDGYRLKINAFDRNPEAKQRLAHACPEVLDPRYNGRYVPGEAYYYVTVHGGVDVTTQAFADMIKEIKDASFVMVSLGNDDLNVKIATDLRVIFERNKIHPTIYAVVHNSALAKSLGTLTNYRDEKYQITPIGALEDSYSEHVVMHSALEKDALDIHCIGYGGKQEDFFAFEYNSRSSCASALHNRARAELKIYNAHLPDDQRTEQEKKALAQLEHCRWNAYMRSIGYIYSGSPDKSSRNDLGKMHHNLVCYTDLGDGDQQKDLGVVAVQVSSQDAK